MKKIVFLIFAAALMLASCSKEDLTADSIVGTKWKSDAYEEGHVTLDLEFTSKSAALFKGYVDGVLSDYSVVASYSLDYPEISFSWDGDVMMGHFTDNKTLKLRAGSQTADYFATLHKQ